jgi:hypothetical protein
VRQQGQGTRFAVHVLHQQLDQARLQQQPGLVGRSLDDRPQVGVAQGAEQVQAGLDQVSEAAVGGQLPQPVGPQGDDQWSPLGVGGERGEESGLFAGVIAEGQGLFTLVDHQHRCRPRHRKRGEGVAGVGARGHHDDLAPVTFEGRRHPGAHQRRLAAARRSHHRQHPGGRQAPQAGHHIRVSPEEPVGVAHVVGHQAQVRAGGAGLGQNRLGHQRRVLAQDRRLQGDQVRSRLQAQLGGQHGACPVEGAQRLALTAGLVLGQSQQRPTPFPQRRGGHHRLGLD